MLFANTWAIHRTAEYDDSDNFVPERFLGNDFGIKPALSSGSRDAMRRPLYGFGAGRRACSGQKLAENSMVGHSFYLPFTCTFCLYDSPLMISRNS
jgi:cytochrome P450